MVYYSLTYFKVVIFQFTCRVSIKCSETGAFVSKHGLKLEKAHFQKKTNQITNNFALSALYLS